jgi:hypothetical protein
MMKVLNSCKPHAKPPNARSQPNHVTADEATVQEKCRVAIGICYSEVYAGEALLDLAG